MKEPGLVERQFLGYVQMVYKGGPQAMGQCSPCAGGGMTARFIPPDYPGGRILLRSGRVDVGAVFPPVGHNQHRLPWVWRLWKADTISVREGRAKTGLAARSALLSAWRDSLAAMNLTEKAGQE